MRLRVTIGRTLIRVIEAIQSFGRLIQRSSTHLLPIALMVMKPDDLVKFSQESYSRSKNVDLFSNKDKVDSGLNPDETAMAEMIPRKKGKLLLLGIGGGREAFHFSRLGFEVTGVDFVPEMIEKAKENAASRGLKIEALATDMTKLDLAESCYDIIWVSGGMYSSIPTKNRRIEMLKKMRKSLKNKGYLLCTFSFDEKYSVSSPLREFAKKTLAFMTLGNLWYEKGDIISRGFEFLHVFSSVEELAFEFKSGGFEIVRINISKRPMAWSLALLINRI